MGKSFSVSNDRHDALFINAIRTQDQKVYLFKKLTAFGFLIFKVSPYVAMKMFDNKKKDIIMCRKQSYAPKHTSCVLFFFFKEYSEVKNSSRYLPKSISTKKYFNLTKKKPIVPSSSEININPPSRSAKLRFAYKLENGCNFKKFVSNFNYLIDIENLNFDA